MSLQWLLGALVTLAMALGVTPLHAGEKGRHELARPGEEPE